MKQNFEESNQRSETTLDYQSNLGIAYEEFLDLRAKVRSYLVVKGDFRLTVEQQDHRLYPVRYHLRVSLYQGVTLYIF